MASTSKKKVAKKSAGTAKTTAVTKSAQKVLDPSRLRSTASGIPDEYFERTDNVPITKEEVRAIIMSKAMIRNGDYVMDIGCGSGSITVEAAIQATPNGLVTAIDRDRAAAELTRQNLERFDIRGYVGVIHGDALDVLGRADDYDNYEVCDMPPSQNSVIIIGGTGGDTAKIVKACADMLVSTGRIVISTILIETLHAVLGIMHKMPFKDVDITQVTISKSRKTATGTMMLARNPVTIISATKK